MGSFVRDVHCQALVTKMSEETVHPVYIVIEKSSDAKFLKAYYKTRSAVLIGIIHIICGFLALSGNVGLFFTSTRFHYGLFGTGIWSSVFFFISGGLSVCSGKNPNSCLVISTMVMSIFSAISAGILIIFSSFGIAFGVDDYYHKSSASQGEVCFLHILQLLSGVTELFMSITSSSLACKATCCRDEEERSNPYTVKYSSNGIVDSEQIAALDKVLGLHLENKDSSEKNGKDFKYNKF